MTYRSVPDADLRALVGPPVRRREPEPPTAAPPEPDAPELGRQVHRDGYVFTRAAHLDVDPGITVEVHPAVATGPGQTARFGAVRVWIRTAAALALLVFGGCRDGLTALGDGELACDHNCEMTGAHFSMIHCGACFCREFGASDWHPLDTEKLRALDEAAKKAGGR